MAKSLTGVVASDKGDKTIVVSIQSSKTHPIYQKQYFISRKIMAHDDKNEAKEGDKVVIVETRPLSARKRFALKKIVARAGIEHVEPAEAEAIVAEAAEKPARKPATKKKEEA